MFDESVRKDERERKNVIRESSRRRTVIINRQISCYKMHVCAAIVIYLLMKRRTFMEEKERCGINERERKCERMLNGV